MVNMNKIILIIFVLFVGCAGKPIIDSRGGSGNIEHNAERMHDDLQTCKAIAKDETNFVWESSKKIYNLSRMQLLWLPPKAEDTYKEIVVNCMEGRGHQVLSWKLL